jgi:hypothetical protein
VPYEIWFGDNCRSMAMHGVDSILCGPFRFSIAGTYRLDSDDHRVLLPVARPAQKLHVLPGCQASLAPGKDVVGFEKP